MRALAIVKRPPVYLPPPPPVIHYPRRRRPVSIPALIGEAVLIAGAFYALAFALIIAAAMCGAIQTGA